MRGSLSSLKNCFMSEAAANTSAAVSRSASPSDSNLALKTDNNLIHPVCETVIT